MKLRYYQQKAINNFIEFIKKNNKNNSLIVMPTGSGKSVVLAGMIKEFLLLHPTKKILVVTHRKELIEQDYQKTYTLLKTEKENALLKKPKKNLIKKKDENNLNNESETINSRAEGIALLKIQLKKLKSVVDGKEILEQEQPKLEKEKLKQEIININTNKNNNENLEIENNIELDLKNIDIDNLLGLYGASLNKKEIKQVTFLQIQSSVGTNLKKFKDIDLVIVDEAHLISPKNKNNTNYQKLIEQLKKQIII